MYGHLDHGEGGWEGGGKSKKFPELI